MARGNDAHGDRPADLRRRELLKYAAGGVVGSTVAGRAGAGPARADDEEDLDCGDVSFHYSPAHPEPGERVEFDHCAAQAHSWDFGDGSSGYGTEVGHAFEETGSYAVTASYTDPHWGYTYTSSRTVVVEGGHCEDADFYVDPADPTTNDEVTFVSCKDPAQYDVRWEFDGGGGRRSASGHRVRCEFDEPGEVGIEMAYTFTARPEYRDTWTTEGTLKVAEPEVAVSAEGSFEGVPTPPSMLADVDPVPVTFEVDADAQAGLEALRFRLDTEDEADRRTPEGGTIEYTRDLPELVDAETLFVTGEDRNGATYTEEVGIDVRPPPDWARQLLEPPDVFGGVDEGSVPDSVPLGTYEVTVDEYSTEDGRLVFDASATKFGLEDPVEVDPSEPISDYVDTDLRTSFYQALAVRLVFDAPQDAIDVEFDGGATLYFLGKGLEARFDGSGSGTHDGFERAELSGWAQGDLSPLGRWQLDAKGFEIGLDVSISFEASGDVTIEEDLADSEGKVDAAVEGTVIAGSVSRLGSIGIGGTVDTGVEFGVAFPDGAESPEEYVQDPAAWLGGAIGFAIDTWIWEEDITIIDGGATWNDPENVPQDSGEVDYYGAKPRVVTGGWSIADPRGAPPDLPTLAEDLPLVPGSGHAVPALDRPGGGEFAPSTVGSASTGAGGTAGSARETACVDGLSGERPFTRRLTRSEYVDESPAVARLGDDPVLAWVCHPEDADPEAGPEIAVGTPADGTPIDPTFVTGRTEDAHDAPALETADGRALLAWVSIEGPLEAHDGPEDAATEAEISFARYDGSSWSDPTRLTAGGATQFMPTVAAIDGGWVVVWEAAEGIHRWSDSHAVRYAVVDRKGRIDAEGRIPDAAEPAVTADGDQVDMLAIDRSTEGEAVDRLVHERIEVGDGQPTRSTVGRYDVGAEYLEHAAGAGSFVWVEGQHGEETLQFVADAAGTDPAPTSSRFDDGVAVAGNLDLVGTDRGPLLAYLGETSGDEGVSVAYRLAVDGEWIADHPVATAPADHLVDDLAAAPTPGGFHAVTSVKGKGPSCVPNLFAAEHGFAPALRVGALRSEPDRAPSDETVVGFGVENVGDVASPAGVPVEVRGARELATLELPALDPGASVEEDTTVPLDREALGDGGAYAVAVQPGDDGAASTAAEATVPAAEPDLVVEAVREYRTDSALAVGVELANRGEPLVTRARVALLVDGEELAATAVDPPVAGPVELRVDPDAEAEFDGPVQATVEVTGPLSGTDARRKRWLHRPNLAVYEPDTYRETDGLVRTSVPVSNAGTGPVSATLAASRAGPSSESLGEVAVDLLGSDGETERFQQVTVELPGVAEGDEVAFRVSSPVGDVDPSTTVATGTVSLEDGPPPIEGSLPLDLNGDGLHRDLNGNGRVDFDDVVRFNAHYRDDVVQDHPEAYDFDGDGEVTEADVERLFEDVSKEQ